MKESREKNACPCGRQRNQCIDCMTFEEAKEKGFICLFCAVKQTRSAACRECFDAMLGQPLLRVESVVQAALELFFPGANFCTQVRSGGMLCEGQLNGASCTSAQLGEGTRKTKLSYSDMEIVFHEPYFDEETGMMVARKKNLGFECDEHCHEREDVDCEASRLDTLKYGKKDSELCEQLLYRFNPHAVAGEKLPDLTGRLRTLVQIIRDESKISPKAGDEHKMTVQYLFYKSNSAHIKLARRLSSTFNVLSDITEELLLYDDDIAAFTLDNLNTEKVDAVAVQRLTRALEEDGDGSQCRAINSVGNALKEKQCSRYAPKKHGGDLCSRHLLMQRAGKEVVLAGDRSAEKGSGMTEE